MILFSQIVFHVFLSSGPLLTPLPYHSPVPQIYGFFSELVSVLGGSCSEQHVVQGRSRMSGADNRSDEISPAPGTTPRDAELANKAEKIDGRRLVCGRWDGLY